MFLLIFQRECSYRFFLNLTCLTRFWYLPLPWRHLNLRPLTHISALEVFRKTLTWSRHSHPDVAPPYGGAQCQTHFQTQGLGPPIPGPSLPWCSDNSHFPKSWSSMLGISLRAGILLSVEGPSRGNNFWASSPSVSVTPFDWYPSQSPYWRRLCAYNQDHSWVI